MGRDRYPRQALGALYGRIKQVRRSLRACDKS